MIYILIAILLCFLLGAFIWTLCIAAGRRPVEFLREEDTAEKPGDPSELG